MKILHLTIYKQWFDEIREGTKTEEYRLIKPHWEKRLRNKKFDVVCFRNGFHVNSPIMYVECLGIEESKEDKVFIIKLGKVLGGIFTPAERMFNEMIKLCPETEK